ncbi:MAG: YicC family protein [Candidatus Binatia bacterium]
MKSMTGYGEATAQGRSVRVLVQLRTLNHRNLDLQARLPREYLSLEEEIRRLMREKIARGRVELFVTRSVLKGQGRRVDLDERLLSQYLQSFRRIKRRFGLQGNVDLSLCAGLPDLFQFMEAEGREKEESGLVFKALSGALKNLERSREREGKQLMLDVVAQTGHLRGVSATLAKEAGKIGLRLKQSLVLKESGEALAPGASAANGGWTFKGDIHEETVRLKTHVSELGRLVRRRSSMGKRIEFLLQEIIRELNTISSKAPQLPVVQLVVAGKERVEKIREQAQNIE